jgi:hypothetical protein
VAGKVDDVEAEDVEVELGATALLLTVLRELDDDLELKLGADKGSFPRQLGGSCLDFLAAGAASVSGLGRLLMALDSTSAFEPSETTALSSNASCMAFRRC